VKKKLVPNFYGLLFTNAIIPPHSKGFYFLSFLSLISLLSLPSLLSQTPSSPSHFSRSYTRTSKEEKFMENREQNQQLYGIQIDGGGVFIWQGVSRRGMKKK
jgi:hypothetical protein